MVLALQIRQQLFFFINKRRGGCLLNMGQNDVGNGIINPNRSASMHSDLQWVSGPK